MALSKPKQRSQDYPQPYIVPPISGTHRHSFIVLHGRGDKGETFGTGLMRTNIPEFTSLHQAFPDAKFVFPTASLRRATVLGRSMIHQWFDIHNIKEQVEREELQLDGLRESFLHVSELLETEIAECGGENVVLWGLSQGMAQSMISLLLWTGPNFAACVGMCGWLPLKARMDREVQEAEDLEDEDNPFDSSEASASTTTAAEEDFTKLQKLARYLCEELQLPKGNKTPKALEIPIFLGHGMKDEKVPTALGEEAKGLLELLDFDVEFQTYEIHRPYGHWYSPEMLRDIIYFLQRKTGVQPA